MTEIAQPGVAPVATPPKKKKRVFMWFFLAVQALFLIWIFGGIGGADNASECAAQTNAYLSQSDCEAARNVGTGIGVMMVVGFWLAVDFILGITYLIVRLARR